MINQKRLISLIQRLIQIDSQNPPGNETVISEYIKAYFSARDFDIKTYSFQKNRPNVVVTLKGRLPRAQAARKAILMTPHTDTVPLGSGW